MFLKAIISNYLCRLKVFPDDKLNIAEMTAVVKLQETFVGKEENTGYIFFFAQCF